MPRAEIGWRAAVAVAVGSSLVLTGLGSCGSHICSPGHFPLGGFCHSLFGRVVSGLTRECEGWGEISGLEGGVSFSLRLAALSPR